MTGACHIILAIECEGIIIIALNELKSVIVTVSH